MDDWKKLHGEVIQEFITYLNRNSSGFILKGGTALLLCYGLDRFSEDIDLDGMDKEIEKYVASFCEEKGFSYRTAKNTDTVKRFMMNYGNAGKPLKIEVSYRKKEILPEETSMMHGIRVYEIEPLCIMKVNSYNSRDRIRDLYDVTFIYNHYKDALSYPVHSLLQSSLQHKGIAYFDYIVNQQSDELIDDSKLAEDFLTMYDDLGLLYDEDEDALMSEYYDEEMTIENDETGAAQKDDELEL